MSVVAHGPLIVSPFVHSYVCIMYVCMFVCSFVLPLRQSFALKVSQMGISQQPLIRTRSYLGHGYLGDFAYIPWILAPESMHRGGAGGQNLGHTKKSVVLLFLCLPLLKTLGQTSVIRMSQPLVSWGKGQSDLYFMVEWFCLISWRLFDGWMSNIV